MESIRSFSVIENNSIWFESSCRTVWARKYFFSDRSISIERPCTLRTVSFSEVTSHLTWSFEKMAKKWPKMAKKKFEEIESRPKDLKKSLKLEPVWIRFRHQIIFTSSWVHQIFKCHVPVPWRTSEPFFNIHEDFISREFISRFWFRKCIFGGSYGVVMGNFMGWQTV